MRIKGCTGFGSLWALPVAATPQEFGTALLGRCVSSTVQLIGWCLQSLQGAVSLCRPASVLCRLSCPWTVHHEPVIVRKTCTVFYVKSKYQKRTATRSSGWPVLSGLGRCPRCADRPVSWTGWFSDPLLRPPVRPWRSPAPAKLSSPSLPSTLASPCFHAPTRQTAHDPYG